MPMMNKLKRINTQKGIGLIEVLVTVVITTVGLLGLSALQMQSIRSVSDTGNRTHAIWIANDLINRIRANEVAVNSYITEEIRCESADGTSLIETGLKMCAAYSDGTNQQPPATDCSNTDLAVFDQWEALCGISAITGIDAFSGSASFINKPGLAITNIGDGDLQITVSWNSRTGGTDADGETVYYVDDGSVAANQRESYSVVFRP